MQHLKVQAIRQLVLEAVHGHLRCHRSTESGCAYCFAVLLCWRLHCAWKWHSPHARPCRRMGAAGSACWADAVDSTAARGWGTVSTRKDLLDHQATPQGRAGLARDCQDGCVSQLPMCVVEVTVDAALGAPERAQTTAERWQDCGSVRGSLEPAGLDEIAPKTFLRHAQHLRLHSRSSLQEPQNHAWHGSVVSNAPAWHVIRE